MAGSRDFRGGAPVSGPGFNRLHLVGANGAVVARRPISVLYVEDDQEDVYLLRRQIRALPSFDVQFSHASTVADARAMTHERHFDVVLCDFWLGHETTISLIDELKLSSRPSPVVLVSSLENDDIELIGRRAGAAGFVAKADLSAASLDRIFVTLLPQEAADEEEQTLSGGAASWLRAVMRGIDAIRATGLAPRGPVVGAAAEVLSQVAAGSEDLRRELMVTLAGLERATRLGAHDISRFDSVPLLADAVARLEAQAGATVTFVVPAMPIHLEASPSLFSDLLQGFFAEAARTHPSAVSVEPAIRGGRLVVEISAGSGDAPRTPSRLGDGADRALAAAEARRLVVASLAEAVGGRLSISDRAAHGGITARLEVPLRASF